VKAMNIRIAGCMIAAVFTVCITSAVAAEKVSTDELRKALYKSYQSEKEYKYDDAVKALAQILKANPQNYTLNMRLGWLYYMLGNYEYSKSSYQNAIKASPASIEAKTGCMLPLLALGKYNEVDDLTQQVLADDPGNYYAGLRYAYSLRMQGHFEQAYSVAMCLRKMYPSDTTVLTEVAMLKWAVNDTNAAKAAFNEILTLNPYNKFAKDMLEKLSSDANTAMGRASGLNRQ